MNTDLTIRFGTDGWRAIIAEDFTFENVERVSRAIAAYLQTLPGRAQNKPRVVIGFDTRFHSERFAKAVADTLVKHGIDVTLSSVFVSTPALSSAVVSLRSDIGVMISASHNPPDFNGIKIKSPQGCSAPETVTSAVEKMLDKNAAPATGSGTRAVKDITPQYFKRLREAVDINLIKRSHLKIVADPMHGAATGYLPALVGKSKCGVTTIHESLDPLFGGLHPEPIEAYLADLKKAVRLNGADAGLATDGDGDRIGVVDEKGRYLSPHQIFPLLLYYLCKYKGMKGKVVQAISLGMISERIAKDFALPFEEVPIGFKYIAERIINEKILIGGEESGGYGYGSFLPERDGILNSLLIMEMLAATRKSLSALLKEVEKKYGSSAFERTDFPNPGIPKKEFVETLKEKAPAKIAGLKVVNIKDYDGIEFILEDDSWLLLRPSGTEPIIRVYSESSSAEKTSRIIKWGQQTVKALQQ